MKIIQIDGVIGWDINGRDIRRQLQAAGGEDVRVEINSPGGFVVDGLEIFNRLRNYSGAVHTHIMSLAASMGSYIALAGDPGKRTAEANAVYMIHNVWGIGIGDHREMRAEADILEGLTGLLSKAYMDATGKSESEVRELMDAETFLFGDEMVEAGFIDEIVQGDDSGDSADSDRDGAVAVARASLDSCLAKLKEVGQTEEDQQKVAALLNVQHVKGSAQDDTIKAASKGGQPDQEVNMDLQKLKADYPALYKAVLQEGKEAGRTEEKDRVAGHLEMAKSTGAVDYAHECIAGEAKVTDQAVFAKYTTAGLNKKATDDRELDNADDDLGDNGDQDETAAGKALLESVMARSSKKGGAANPGMEV
jgi:ATP-dependent Clp endopeptidase proteolytic subunit ClpP